MQYVPVQTERHFDRETFYDKIDWKDLKDILKHFELRLRDWYIEPAETLRKTTGHYAFSIMAINCLLIDTLSQFETGAPKSSGKRFIDFSKKHLSGFGGTGHTSIRATDRNGNPTTLMDFSEILYVGFRCGILHQAHIPLYGAVDPGYAKVVGVEAGATKYADGTDCPTVVINPLLLFDNVGNCFGNYMAKLWDSDASNDTLRAAFATKFKNSFGIDISKAKL